MSKRQGNAIMVMLMVLIIVASGWMIESLSLEMDTPRKVFYFILVCCAGGMLFHAWERDG